MGNNSILMVFFLILGYNVMKISCASSSPDIDKDRQECTTQLVGLATCLTYVGGNAKAPTPDCCTGLKQVVGKSMKCLCVLVKDRDDPSLGLKINATLALGLPKICKVPSKISECPALLHLAPNSPEAKVFEQFAKDSATTPSAPASSGGNAKTSPSGGSSAQEKSEAGGKRMVLFGVEMVGGVFLWCFTSLLIFINGVFI